MSFYSRRPQTFLMLLTLIMTFSVVIAPNTPTAKAAPLTIDVSPSSAPVGGEVAISGANATPNGEVRIYVHGFFFLTTTTADETGNYSINITTPAVSAGPLAMIAIDVETGNVANAPFSVEPLITLIQTEGSPHDKTTVVGNGFRSGSNVTLDFEGTDVTPYPQPQTDFLGSFEATFTAPSVPSGVYTVVAEDLWANSAKAEFTIVPKTTIWPQSSGAPTSMRIIDGYGYARLANITAHFGEIEITPISVFKTSNDGSFSLPFFVPNVDNGAYTVNASDETSNWASASFIVGSPILSLTPDKSSNPSIVTAKGSGFPIYTPVLLYMENMTMTNLVDLMWMSESLISDEDGAFEYSFVVPITEPGIYNIVAYSVRGSSPSERKEIASAPLTVIDNSPIDIQTKVGSLHFTGEIAEFYATTSHNGKLVNVTIDKATLYYSNGASNQELTTNIEQVAPGVYRIPYEIPPDAPVGTYTLTVETSYATGFTELFGTSSASFLVSQTLIAQNSQITSIDGSIATIIVPDLGTIKANLTTVNARLGSLNDTMATLQTSIGTINTNIANIQLNVTSVHGSIATIHTLLGSMQGNITGINGTLATISTSLGTVETDIGNLASEVTPAGYEISLATLILALIAALGTLLPLISAARKKTVSPLTPTIPTAPQPPLPPEDPTPQTPT